MARKTLLGIIATFATAPWTAAAADCSQRRRDSSPAAGKQLRDIIYHNNWLDVICKPNWSSNPREASFNRGHVKVQITRQDTTKLSHCSGAINNIIEQCISGGPYSGGSWSLDGEKYTIYDDSAPENPTGPITAPPAGATVLTETIGGTKYTITYTRSTATEPVTTSTKDKDGNVVPVIIPIGAVLWGIFGAPPPNVPVTPPPPILPTPTPGGGGKPDDGKQDDDDNCRTSTVDHCVRTCSEVVEQKKTSTKCGDPSCTKATGCSVTATTSTVTTKAAVTVGPPMEIIEVPGFDPQEVLGAQDAISADLGLKVDPVPTPATDPVPTQAAVPIKDLPCLTKVSDPIPPRVVIGGQTREINDLFWGLRQQLCAGPCTAPEGVDKSFVAVYPKDGGFDDICEISVGVTDKVEAYCTRNSKPDPSTTQWQACFDAIEVIIEKCIKNGPNSGWWNGDHVYQYYDCGTRPLNSDRALHKDNKITKWLGAAPDSGHRVRPDTRLPGQGPQDRLLNGP